MRLSVLLFFASTLVAQAVSPVLIVRNEQIPSPAEVGSAGAHLSSSERGDAWMIWTEPSATGTASVRVSRFDLEKRAWSPAATLAAEPNISVDAFSTPQIAVDDDGNVAALWYVAQPPSPETPHGTTRAMISRSPDRGLTWSAAATLSRESSAQEFASLAALGDGRFVSAWLDGRNAHRPGGAQTLYARDVFSSDPDAPIDDRVCDCCATSLAGFPDGSVRVVYRDRSDDEVREIFTSRFVRDRWTSPAPLSRGHWKIDGCPVNGPTISAHAAHVAVAWFTAEDEQPRVFAALSATAGEPFLMPARVDDGKPVGQVGIVTLQDGTALVSWIEATENGAAYLLLRRLSPDETLSVPVRVAAVSAGRKTGVPRVTRLADTNGGAAKILVAYTEVNGDTTHIVTRLLGVEPPSADRNPCANCPPVETRGHPVHGYIQSVDTEKRLARVRHDEIPGVMPAMTMRFHVAAEDMDALPASGEIFGRIEQREDGWWLFAIRSVSRE